MEKIDLYMLYMNIDKAGFTVKEVCEKAGVNFKSVSLAKSRGSITSIIYNKLIDALNELKTEKNKG